MVAQILIREIQQDLSDFFFNDCCILYKLAIWSYEEALSLIPNSHYYYLETLLGLCCSLFQRYHLLGHIDDLNKHLLYLDLQCDVLYRKRSLLTLVDVQLFSSFHPSSPVIDVTPTIITLSLSSARSNFSWLLH